MNKKLRGVLCKILLLTPITAMESLEQTQLGLKSFTESFLTAHPNPSLEYDFTAKIAFEEEIKLQRKNDKAERITFYHTQCWDGILLEELHRLLAPENRHHYFRGPQSLPEGVWDATTFIQRPDFLKGNGYTDTKAQNRPHILCVSLSLQDKDGMESAAGFFNRPAGALGSNCDANKAISLESLVNHIIDSYATSNEKLRVIAPEIKEKFLETANNVMERVSSSSYRNIVGGTHFFKHRMHRLYTFSIPLENLNTVFYLSLPFGNHNISGDMVGVYNAMRADYASGKNYIEQNTSSFENPPEKGFNLNTFWRLFEKNPQGRLLISHPLLQNPDILNYKAEEIGSPEGKALYGEFLEKMTDIKAFIRLLA